MAADPASLLKTNTGRALQIQRLWERLSAAFSLDAAELIVGQASQHVTPPGTSSASLTLSPSDRAKFNSLTDKLERVLTLHLFNAPDNTTLLPLSLLPYPSLRHLLLDMVPPSTLSHLASHRAGLQSLEIVNSGIAHLSALLAPGGAAERERLAASDLQPMCLPCSGGYFSHGRAVSARGAAQPSQLQQQQQTHRQQQDEEVQGPGPLSDLVWPALSLLRLRNCGLTRLDATLHLLPHCALIDLSHNSITHVVHLHDCLHLTTLDVSHNRVRVLSNLDRVLGNVVTLNLSYNRIASLDGLNKLYSLEQLDLRGNLIDDPVEIAHLALLPCLERLALSPNPLSSRSDASTYRVCVLSQLAAGTLSMGRLFSFVVFGCMPCRCCRRAALLCVFLFSSLSMHICYTNIHLSICKCYLRIS